ncbi:hypothetical protein HS088_TW20G00369 [Tripterygium wilfordii]|uniref:Uncharacterized protein n=1 Tax=Tripterygium wilfordii TaxID=458696 RepID=A0A7J7C789_TRIWF|nr:hypothetical protein HS088_TW20G00369 [Tripterygium wilfordii]
MPGTYLTQTGNPLNNSSIDQCFTRLAVFVHVNDGDGGEGEGGIGDGMGRDELIREIGSDSTPEAVEMNLQKSKAYMQENRSKDITKAPKPTNLPINTPTTYGKPKKELENNRRKKQNEDC